MGSGFDGERHRSGSVAQPGRQPAGGASRERLRAFLEMAATAVVRA